MEIPQQEEMEENGLLREIKTEEDIEREPEAFSTVIIKEEIDLKEELEYEGYDEYIYNPFNFTVEDDVGNLTSRKTSDQGLDVIKSGKLSENENSNKDFDNFIKYNKIQTDDKSSENIHSLPPTKYEHMQTHTKTELRKHVSSIKKSSQNTSSQYNVNLKNTTPKNFKEKPHRCPVCNTRYSMPEALKIHMRVHSDNKHECKICKKKFRFENTLTQHMKFHNGEKPYNCQLCDENFSKPNALFSHMSVHTGGKKFECIVCNKKLSRPEALKVHMRIHVGEKPHECDVCKKRFTQAIDLIRHKRIHSGEKPFECSRCNKKFARMFNLTRHIDGHIRSDHNVT